MDSPVSTEAPIPVPLPDISSNSPQNNATQEKTSGIKRPISYIRERRREREEKRDKENPVVLSPERSSAVAGAGTGEQFDQTKKTKPSSEVLPRTKIEIRQDVVDGHANFLYEHLVDLNVITNTEVLQGVRGEVSRWLLQHFKSGEQIDRAKIDAFAKSDRGLQIIEEIMDIRTQDEILALGLYLSASYGSLMQGAPDTRTVINVDALGRMFDGRLGALRRSVITTRLGTLPIGRFADRRAGLAGATMGAVIGAPIGGMLGNISENIPGVIASLKHLTESQVGAILGGVGGAVGGGILGRRFLTNNGDIDLNACKAGLKIIKNSGDREYLRAISGIDIDDFRVVNDQVIWNPRMNPANLETNVPKRLRDIRERLHTRQKYYKSIDVPLPSTRTVPFTEIGPNFRHRDETDTRWGRRIRELSEARLEGVRNRTFERRVQADREARLDVLREDLVDYFQKISGDSFIEGQGWVSSTERVSGLKAQKTEVEKNKTDYTKRLTERKVSLETGQLERLKTLSATFSERLTTERADSLEVATLIANHADVIDVSKITTVEDLLTAINKEINSLTRKISAERRKPKTELRKAERSLRTGPSTVDLISYRAQSRVKEELSTQIDQARRITSNTSMQTEFQNNQDEIDAITADLASGTYRRGTPEWTNLQSTLKTLRENQIYVNYRNAQEIVSRYDAAETFLSNLTIPQRDAIREYDLASRELDARGDQSVIDDFKTKISKLEEARKLINTGKVNTATKKQELEDKEKSLRPIKERLRTDRNRFEEMGITDGELSTLSVGELIAKVNEIYETDVYLGIIPPLGWPEGQNNNQSNIDQLVNAKVESRSREHLSYSINIMTNVMETLNQNREQFRSSSAGAINQSMNEIFILSGGTQGWEQADNEIMSILIGRAQVIGYDENAAFEYSLGLTMHDIEREVTEIDEQTKAISNGELIKRVDMSISLMQNQGQVFSSVSEEFRDSDKRPKFFSADIPAPDDNVYTTPQERASREVQAYHEFLNLLFKYQKEPDRGSAFHRSTLLLPPNELARILRTSLGLTYPDDDFSLVIVEVEDRFNNGEIDERDMRIVMGDIISYVEGRTRGMLN